MIARLGTTCMVLGTPVVMITLDVSLMTGSLIPTIKIWTKCDVSSIVTEVFFFLNHHNKSPKISKVATILVVSTKRGAFVPKDKGTVLTSVITGTAFNGTLGK
jgi:hypothetical protein